MQHSSQQQPSLLLQAGSARKAGSQAIVTPRSVPNVSPDYDREILGPILPFRQSAPKCSEITTCGAGRKVGVGVSGKACNEGVTGSNPVEGSIRPSEASWNIFVLQSGPRSERLFCYIEHGENRIFNADGTKRMPTHLWYEVR